VNQLSEETFDLKPEHVALLRMAWIDWCDVETGAPCIDPKRPYGNSFVAGDVYEIVNGHEWDSDDEMPDDVTDAMDRLHRETQTALQVILATGSFEPGHFVKRSPYDSQSWERDA
jgi:hypothetical protein